jgi:hypothetical protein
MNSAREAESYQTAHELLNHSRYAEAFAIYEDLAKAGDPQCQVFLGWMYYEGLGVTKDAEKALNWFERAASLGSKEGAFYCGRSTASLGRYEEAIKWFHAAAKQEYGPALLWLGLMHVRGLGITANLEKGIDYLRRAVKAGSFLAQRELAFLMIRGKLGISKIPSGVALLLYSVIGGIAAAVSKGPSDRLIG